MDELLSLYIMFVMFPVPMIILTVIWVSLYILPIVIAHKRRHPHRVPIILLTIITGWSLIGWVIALVWSVMPIPAKPPPLPAYY